MADSKSRSIRCFNPFKLQKHAKKNREQLRKVLRSHLLKWGIPITPTSLKYFVCGTCRIKIQKIHASDDNSGHNRSNGSWSGSNMEDTVIASISADDTSESDLNSSLVAVKREGIENFNTRRISSEELPIIKRTLALPENSPPEKLQKFHETMDEEVFIVEDDDEKDGSHEEYHGRLPYTFRGHVAPVLTPFLNDSARSLNLSIIPQYAQFLAERGVTGILVNGTSGEGPSMNVEERKAVAEAWVRAVKSTKQHLMLQIGGACLSNVLELAKHAEIIGVDSLLCLPELYFKPTTPEQLVEYLRLVGQAAPKTPLLYYHIPIFSNVNINMPKFLESVGDSIPSFVGIKFTSTNLEEATQAFRVNNKEFAVFLGSDQIMAGAFAQGMDSAITTTINLLPEVGIGILKASAAGDMAKARELQEKFTKAVIAITKYGGWVETMKVAMGLLTPFDVGPPRAPLTPLSTESVASMRQGLKALSYQVLR